MPSLRTLATDWLDAGRRAVVVEVVEARGSAPREAGTRMLVSADDTAGTIGGGHLELKAIDEAREMLRCDDRHRAIATTHSARRSASAAAAR